MTRRRSGRLGASASATSMATRLAAAVVAVSLVSLVIATIIGLNTGRDLGEDLYRNRLTALRTSASGDVSSDMNALATTSDALASSPQAAEAIRRFSSAFDDLQGEDLGDRRTQVADLLDSYKQRFLDPQSEVGLDLDVRDIIPSTDIGVHLQHLYAINFEPADDAAAVNDAGDGSDWTATHALVHPVYRDIADRAGLVDVFLVDAEGRAVYSVRKNPDFATDLETGPFSGSVLSTAVRRALEDPDAGPQVSDLAFYNASLQPIGVVASPVLDGDTVVGAVALMYDSERLTASLTAEGEWEDAGYPDTSDTYMIGSDGTTRSDPRGFVEDPSGYLDEVQEAGGLSDEQRAAVEARGTTVLTLRASDPTYQAIEDDDTAIESRASISGHDVYSTIERVDVDGPTWWTAAEVDASVARSDVEDFREVLVVGVAIFVVVLAFLAVLWANRIVSPVREISNRLARRETSDEAEPLVVPDRSPIEFHRLADAFESMARSLRSQRANVAAARAERLDLLRRMLPPAVAQRVASGQVQALEDVTQVSVGVLLVDGLGDLVRIDDGASGREFVDRLGGELDELAERHGIERIKVVGDAYFAACGHDRPYLDHAPRMVEFASDARDAIRDLGGHTSSGLDISAGVHTGPVTVGMTGGERLVYDVWGPTVTLAHHVARRAAAGQILATDATRALLPESVEVVPVDPLDSAIAASAAASGGPEADVVAPEVDGRLWSIETATVRGPA